jgi:hypothetical protein
VDDTIEEQRVFPVQWPCEYARLRMTYMHLRVSCARVGKGGKCREKHKCRQERMVRGEVLALGEDARCVFIIGGGGGWARDVLVAQIRMRM